MMNFFDPPKKNTVLVTGASSYLGSLVVAWLLNLDYIVRGTVRSIEKMPLNLADLTTATSSSRMKNFFLFEADLMDPDQTWSKIIEGCDSIVHVAAPNGIIEPKDSEKELMKPTIEGTVKILNLALILNVKKFVYISCITTIVTSDRKNYIFSQKDWADIKQLNKMSLCKYLAERKAWEIYEKNSDKISFTSLVPGLMMGPSLKRDSNLSSIFLQKSFDKTLQKVPHISFPMVDVRDVARAVTMVLNNPISNGKRYLIVQGSYWWQDVANILRVEFEKYGYELPKKKMSNFWIYLASWWNPFLSYIKPYLEGELIIDTSLFINEIGMPYRKIEETFIDFAYDLIKKKLIEDKLFFIGDDQDPPYLH